MAVATGVLKRINAKHGTNARGEWTAYSICVGPAANNDNDTWYRLGFEKPKVNEGSVVKFDYEEDARGNKKVVGDILVDKTATEAVAKQTSKPRGGGGGGYNDPERQASIIRQSATKDGISIVNMMLEHGVVEIPKKKADRFDFVLELVTNVADGLVPTYTTPPSIEELAERALDGEKEEDAFDDNLDKAFEEDDDKWEAV